jgi:hypothetical protein
MSAKEMFEELGYKYNNQFEIISYSKSDMSSYIYFNKYKDIIINVTGCCVSLKLFKAIQQQITELGWEDR